MQQNYIVKDRCKRTLYYVIYHIYTRLAMNKP